MKLVIVAAMKEELAPFRQYYRPTKYWETGPINLEQVNQQLYFVESGIGKVNAAAAAVVICEKLQPDLIINTGTVGAFSSTVGIGDIVYTDRFVYSDVDATGFGYTFGQVPQMAEEYRVQPQLIEVIAQVLAKTSLAVHFGTIVTADSFMSDSTKITQIKKHFPKILASDMESCALAQVASFYQTPIINVRSFSDYVGHGAPQTFDQNVVFAANQTFKAIQPLINYWQSEN